MIYYTDKKLREIASVIRNSIINNKLPDYPGLYSGGSGILLFLYCYAEYAKDAVFEKLADDFTDILLEQLFKKSITHTFSDGYSGILYLFDFFRQNGYVDIDIEEADAVFNEFIIKKTSFDLQNSNYDFIHGALGSDIYFFKKGIHPEEVSNLLNHLYQTGRKSKDNTNICWEFQLNLSGERGYNIALSHGVSSVVLFLLRLKVAGFIHPHIDELLEGTVHFLLSQEIDYKIYGSFFPNQSKANIHKSRLAWCYGDLGVAYALWKAGKVCGNEHWKAKALDVFLFSASRRSFKDAMINDAGICHGTGGLAMFFNRIYKETKNEVFKETADFWIKETLNCASFEDGLAGYKSYDPIIHFKPDYSLLTGIAGIGLVLLSYLNQDEQAWDELFLLS